MPDPSLKKGLGSRADDWGREHAEAHRRAEQLRAAAPLLLAALKAYQAANRLHHDAEAALFEQAETAIIAAEGTTP